MTQKNVPVQAGEGKFADLKGPVKTAAITDKITISAASRCTPVTCAELCAISYCVSVFGASIAWPTADGSCMLSSVRA